MSNNLADILRSAVGYDTPLTPAQSGKYQQWRANLPRDLQNTEDYDLQGAYLASMKADGRAHMGDQFKKPNHMTFSDGSQYSTPQQQGGHWVGTGLPNPANTHEDQSAFWASPFNQQQHSVQDLMRYFGEAERGNPLILQSNYRLPPQ